MAAAASGLTNLVSLSVKHVALNPLITASLLWVLTKGPPQAQERLFGRFTSLRDPERLARVIKALKWLLAFGVTKTVNKQLNKLALNSWRLNDEKKRWNWSQEIVVITGGCSGIGEMVVRKLVDRGVTVAVLDIQQLPTSLQGFSQIKFFACDITDPATVYDTAKRIKTTLGSPTVLINNAGIARAHTILNTSDEDLRKIFDVNLLSNFTLVKAFLPDMIKANKGHVVTVASTASYIGVAGMVDYTSTKSGVLAFHEGLKQELKLKYKAPNVLLTSIHPNWVRTPLIAPFEEEIERFGSKVIEPREAADAIVQGVVSCSGGQVFLPSTAARLSMLRGLPNWLQESFRHGVGGSVVKSAE